MDITDGSGSGMTDGRRSGMTDGSGSGIADGSASGMADGSASGMAEGSGSGMTDGSGSGMADGSGSGMTDGSASGKLTPAAAPPSGRVNPADARQLSHESRVIGQKKRRSTARCMHVFPVMDHIQAYGHATKRCLGAHRHSRELARSRSGDRAPEHVRMVSAP